MIIGAVDTDGWGADVAGTILNAGIRWDRCDFDNDGEIARAIGYGFDVLGLVANSDDGTLITTLDNATHAALAVSQIEAEPGPRILEFINEPWLKGGEAHPVKYARLYMAALTAIRAAGYTERLLFAGTGGYQNEASTQTCTTVSGSPIVSMASTDEISPGQPVSDSNSRIPADSYVASVDADGTHWTIGNAGSPNALSSGDTSVTFDQHWSYCEDPDGGWIGRAIKTVAGLKEAIIANGLSFHPYGMPTENGNSNGSGIQMVAYHATRVPEQLGSHVPFWVSEFGYNIDGGGTGRTTGSGVDDEAEQATRMGEAFTALEAIATVEAAFYYESHDLGWGFMNSPPSDPTSTRASFAVIAAHALANTFAPTIETSSVRNITRNSATVTGTVNPHWIDTTYRFEYGPTSSYGQSTTETGAGDGNDPVVVSAPISNLGSESVYHYRLVATSEGGTSYSADQTFTTTGHSSVPTVDAATLLEPAHLKWPLEFAADGTLATVEQDSLDDVRQCIHVLLSTPRGVRPLAPEVGIEDPAFAGVDPDELKAVLEEQEPRATVTITADQADASGEQTVQIVVELADETDQELA